MTIYEGSRYTDATVYSLPDASAFIGMRLTNLHSDVSIGSNQLLVHSVSGMYMGKQINILDYPNTETVTVQSVGQPMLMTMWNPKTQTYSTMNVYPVTLQGYTKYAHSMLTTVQVPKTNYRPTMISTFANRNTYIETDNTDEVVTWVSGNRLDILAYQTYGDSQLGWAILDANPQYMSELDISIGDIVVVPSYQKVFTQIMRGGS